MYRFIIRGFGICVISLIILPIIGFSVIVLMIRNVIAGDPMLERWERLVTILKKTGPAIKIYFKTGEVDSFYEV